MAAVVAQQGDLLGNARIVRRDGAGITVGAPLLAQAAGDDLAAWQGRVLAKRWAA